MNMDLIMKYWNNFILIYHNIFIFISKSHFAIDVLEVRDICFVSG